MVFASWLLTAVVACVVCVHVQAVQEKVIKVEQLSPALLFSQSDRIFSPSSVTLDGLEAAHKVRVYDDEGRFMNLEYTAKHPSDIRLLKMEDKEHRDKIHSVGCSLNTITINFVSQDITNDYLDYFEHGSDEQADYIVGSHLWKCYNPNTRMYSPIIGKVKDININELSLEIEVEHVSSYLSIFSDLDIKYSTNLNADDAITKNSNLDRYHSRRHSHLYSAGSSRSSRLSDRKQRGLLSWGSFKDWVSDTWDDVVEGVEEYADQVGDLVDTIKDEITDKVLDQVLESVNLNKSVSSALDWTQNMSNTYLDSNNYGECKECSVEMEMTYYYEVSIVSGSLISFKSGAKGPVSMVVDITVDTSDVGVLSNGSYAYSSQYNEMSGEEDVPDLSFTVSGVTIGFSTYGVLSVGVESTAKYAEFGAKINGEIERGVMYSKDAGTYEYITDQTLDYSLVGPILEYSTSKLRVYIKPTLYMKMDYVGSLYFGLSSSLAIATTENSGTSTCVIDYTPSGKVTSYIGGEVYLLPSSSLSSFNFTNQVSVSQTVLTNLEGCITQEDLLTYQDGIIETTDSRRLATSDDDSSDSEFNIAIDYTSVDTLAYTSAADVWGKTGSVWWGKLSKEYNFCDRNLPEDGSTLMVQVNNDSALEGFLIGIYTPEFKDYTFYNGDVANMSCTVRIQLDRKNKTRSNSIAAVVFDFTVKLLEYECVSFTDGVEIASFAKASINTFNLSSNADQVYKLDLEGDIVPGYVMFALSAGSNFYSLSLNEFGASGSDCITQRQFLMAKQSVYEFDNSSDSTSSTRRRRRQRRRGLGEDSEDSVDTSEAFESLLGYSEPGWFGKYYCDVQGMISITLYFPDTFDESGDITAMMAINYDNNDDGTYDDVPTEYSTLNGKINFDNQKLCLNNSNTSYAQFCGTVTVLGDGSVHFYGTNVTFKGEVCTAFMVQGDADIESFEEDFYNSGSSGDSGSGSDDTNDDSGSDDSDDGGSTSGSGSSSSGNDGLVWGILIGMVIIIVCGFAGVVIATKCMGYDVRCNKRENESYQMMQS